MPDWVIYVKDEYVYKCKNVDIGFEYTIQTISYNDHIFLWFMLKMYNMLYSVQISILHVLCGFLCDTICCMINLTSSYQTYFYLLEAY